MAMVFPSTIPFVVIPLTHAEGFPTVHFPLRGHEQIATRSDVRITRGQPADQVSNVQNEIGYEAPGEAVSPQGEVDGGEERGFP